MLQISFIAYLVNGLTLNHQYFDLFYVLVSMVVILKCFVKKEDDDLNRGQKERWAIQSGLITREFPEQL